MCDGTLSLLSEIQANVVYLKIVKASSARLDQRVFPTGDSCGYQAARFVTQQTQRN